MRKRLAGIALAVLTTIGLVAVAATPAGAAPVAAPSSLQQINFVGTGVDKSGQSQAVTGTFVPDKAVRHGSTGMALLGTMTVKDAAGQTASRHMSIPGALQGASTPSSTSNAAAPAAAAAPAPGSCNVLNLVLGPLHLNLLGLNIDLNQVVLDLTAVPGAGLLGDLLCGLAGGPAGGLAGALNGLIAALNQLLGAL